MKKLFWNDSYQTEAKAQVTHSNGNKIKLDQTIFYAFSGGQESDEGTINDIKVIEAKKEGDKEDIIDIEYQLESNPFKVGDKVLIKINKEKRDKIRKSHSATHIAYYFLKGKLKIDKLIGSNISEQKGRLDFEWNTPITELLPQLEKDINSFLKENHEIIMKPDEIKPDLKWWTCEDWKMPCGGTHCKTTKEIKQIILKRKNIGKGKERLEIILA